MSNNPYDELGVEKDSTPEEIKKAYRAKAQEAHPDTENGDHERFVRLNAAYKLLMDPDEKRKFDESGVTGEDHPHMREAVNRMKQLFAGYIAQSSRESGFISLTYQTTLEEMINNAISKKEHECRTAMSENAAVIQQVEKLKKKIKCKKKFNLFAVVSDTIINNCNQVIESAKENLEITKLMKTIAADYETESNEQPKKKSTLETLRTRRLAGWPE